MKNISKFLLFILVSNLIFAIDYTTELNSKYSYNNEDISYYNSAKFGIKLYENDLYTEISFLGENYDTNNDLKVYTAFAEIYQNDLTLSIGKQKTNWGLGTLFNLTNIFNQADIKNPKSDKEGINGLDIKYRPTGMSKIEGFLFKNNYSNKNIAVRYINSFNNIEYNLNYLDYKLSLNRIKDIIVEFKGEDIVGYWSQFNYKKIKDTSTKIATLGIDYTFDIFEKNLYIANEIMNNFDEEIVLNYTNFSYSLTDLITYNQTFIFDFKGEENVILSNLSYIFNDYTTIDITNYKYNNIKNIFNTTQSINDKLELEFKINF
ncbi:hypothetical protein EV215_0176 [Hypnocyclicus thermotrophus]|uniref:Uncharacterized protein n=1 Tax=Hypnocyclicus thermotrophus TaxID=1627895 RepID=A0AA46E0I3_9FUSO|nr:hypothetical protein [Hypnocyclicus thermotrophus]TDT72375.1 hypothetical protein EV215_0176 [Hypnocyclicus thermotrophus]